MDMEALEAHTTVIPGLAQATNNRTPRKGLSHRTFSQFEMQPYTLEWQPNRVTAYYFLFDVHHHFKLDQGLT